MRLCGLLVAGSAPATTSQHVHSAYNVITPRKNPSGSTQGAAAKLRVGQNNHSNVQILGGRSPGAPVLMGANTPGWTGRQDCE